MSKFQIYNQTNVFPSQTSSTYQDTIGDPDCLTNGVCISNMTSLINRYRCSPLCNLDHPVQLLKVDSADDDLLKVILLTIMALIAKIFGQRSYGYDRRNCFNA